MNANEGFREHGDIDESQAIFCMICIQCVDDLEQKPRRSSSKTGSGVVREITTMAPKVIVGLSGCIKKFQQSATDRSEVEDIPASSGDRGGLDHVGRRRPLVDRSIDKGMDCIGLEVEDIRQALKLISHLDHCWHARRERWWKSSNAAFLAYELQYLKEDGCCFVRCTLFRNTVRLQNQP